MGDILAVNDIGCYLPRVDHWFSIDPWNLKIWSQVRSKRRCMTWQLYSVGSAPGVREVVLDHVGSSGLMARQLAKMLGYRVIRTAGIPLDEKGHWFEPPLGHWLAPEFPDFRKHRVAL